MTPLIALSQESISSGESKIIKKVVVILRLLAVGTRSRESNDLDCLMAGRPSSFADWTTWTTQCFPGIRSQAKAADLEPS
jgi:hypothetical protein